MQSKVIAILETRTGEHLGELIRRRGGVPLWAPALDEVPDVDPQAISELLERWRHSPYEVVIFQTGVGTRALFDAASALGRLEELLRLLTRSTVVVRGPKPTGELNARGVRMDLKAATPFTSETLLAALRPRPLQGTRVLVQRYGASNLVLLGALRERGAAVDEIATYRWAIPSDIRPLQALLDGLDAARIDAVVFTSAVQVQHLFEVARSLGRDADLAARLAGTFVASVGPVCSRALRERGVEPRFEANPPKLGPLVSGLEAAFSGP